MTLTGKAETMPFAETRGSSTDDELIEDLARQTTAEYARKRDQRRISLQSEVRMRSINRSDPTRFDVRGITCDISSGGCRAVFPEPVLAGDFFRLDLDLSQLDAPVARQVALYARCVRTRFVRENAFEVAFAFMTPIDVTGSRATDDGPRLL